MRRRRGWVALWERVWILFAATVGVSCEGMGPDLGTEVVVDVTGGGNGVGRVTAPDAAVDIDCLVGSGVPNPGSCRDEFIDAGAGGVFSLFAEPNPGSNFISWSGCNMVNGNECVLSFDSTETMVTFDVTATFESDPNDVCNATFGASQGYILCAETATSCTFYTLLNDVDSCATRCATFQQTCINSIRDTEDTCTQGAIESCGDVVGDRLCECTKP